MLLFCLSLLASTAVTLIICRVMLPTRSRPPARAHHSRAVVDPRALRLHALHYGRRAQVEDEFKLASHSRHGFRSEARRLSRLGEYAMHRYTHVRN